MITRERAAELYESLPLPSTSDEHWRFTNLRGFDPDAASAARRPTGSAGPALDLDVSGRALVTESRHRDHLGARRRHLRAARARPRREADSRGRQVRDAEPRRVAARPARACPEGRHAREAALRAGHLDRRLALLADGRRRRRGRAVHPDRGSRLGRARLWAATRTRSSSSSPARARRSSTSRCRTSRARPGTSAATARCSSETASSTG